MPKGDNYTFVGKSDPDRCRLLVADMLDITKCKRDFENCFTIEDDRTIDNSTLLAFSTYFYTTQVLTLTPDHTIDRSSFKNQTSNFCRLNLNETLAAPGVTKKFATNYCFQLNYIELTLSAVYKLQSDWSNIRFTNQVAGQSLGWSLGFMTNATNALPAEAPVDAMMSTFFFVSSLITTIFISMAGLVFLWRWCMVSKRKSQGHESQADIYEPIDQEF